MLLYLRNSTTVVKMEIVLVLLENWFSFIFCRFPLYPKGGEKLQFDYGVYLLNKNIAQVRNSPLQFSSSLLQLASLDCSPLCFINVKYDWLFDQPFSVVIQNILFLLLYHSLLMCLYREVKGLHWNQKPFMNCYLLLDYTVPVAFVTPFSVASH